MRLVQAHKGEYVVLGVVYGKALIVDEAGVIEDVGTNSFTLRQGSKARSVPFGQVRDVRIGDIEFGPW